MMYSHYPFYRLRIDGRRDSRGEHAMFSTGRTKEKDVQYREDRRKRERRRKKESKTEGIYLKFIDLQFNELLIVKFEILFVL